jgi:hypothetical protein
MTTMADLIQRMRTFADDSPSANYIRGETLKPKPDGTRLRFFLDHQNIAKDSIFITNGSGEANYRMASGFNADLSNGIVTFDVAPGVGVNPFEADYNFFWFTDADHENFLNNGAIYLGYSNPLSVIAGLVPAMLQFGLHHYWIRRASHYAHKYASSGGMASHSVDVVSKEFHALANSAWDKGVQFRDDYYKRLGQRSAPASAAPAFGIDPFTPIR